MDLTSPINCVYLTSGRKNNDDRNIPDICPHWTVFSWQEESSKGLNWFPSSGQGGGGAAAGGWPVCRCGGQSGKIRCYSVHTAVSSPVSWIKYCNYLGARWFPFLHNKFKSLNTHSACIDCLNHYPLTHQYCIFASFFWTVLDLEDSGPCSRSDPLGLHQFYPSHTHSPCEKSLISLVSSLIIPASYYLCAWG